MVEPRITVVGASLAGLRTAEALAAALPGAEVRLVGDEPHRPYNRPPLSKEAMTALVGGEPGESVLDRLLALRSRLPSGRIDLRPGTAAQSVDGDAIRLSNGAVLRSDVIVAATGLRPRRLRLPGAEARRHALRSFDDARRLAAAMTPGSRMVVAGGGFIGCEIAATARKLGLHVTIVEPEPQPMLRALGARVAAAMGALHRSHGVALLTGRRVAAFGDDEVVLDDGDAIAADVIVESLGSIPNTEWLQGTGADLADGVLVDGRMWAVGTANILAVGDIARFANPLFDAVPRRIEHWCIPGQTAKRAAETIAAMARGMEPAGGFAPMPSFWSDQYGVRLQSFGAPGLADTQTVVEGDLGNVGREPVVVEYACGGRLVGVLGLGASPASLAAYRSRLVAALAPSLTAEAP